MWYTVGFTVLGDCEQTHTVIFKKMTYLNQSDTALIQFKELFKGLSSSSSIINVDRQAFN